MARLRFSRNKKRCEDIARYVFNLQDLTDFFLCREYAHALCDFTFDPSVAQVSLFFMRRLLFESQHILIPIIPQGRICLDFLKKKKTIYNYVPVFNYASSDEPRSS